MNTLNDSPCVETLFWRSLGNRGPDSQIALFIPESLVENDIHDIKIGNFPFLQHWQEGREQSSVYYLIECLNPGGNLQHMRNKFSMLIQQTKVLRRCMHLENDLSQRHRLRLNRVKNDKRQQKIFQSSSRSWNNSLNIHMLNQSLQGILNQL